MKANLAGANLEGANLSGVLLEDTKFYGANLKGITIGSKNLSLIPPDLLEKYSSTFWIIN